MSTLHYTIPKFFESKMAEHNCVADFVRLEVEDEYAYLLKRTERRPDVPVFLSDAYQFGQADYVSRPKIIKRGGFILIARPEAGFEPELLERARGDGIGIGKIGKLMGALNLGDVSKYKTPEEKEREARHLG